MPGTARPNEHAKADGIKRHENQESYWQVVHEGAVPSASWLRSRNLPEISHRGCRPRTGVGFFVIFCRSDRFARTFLQSIPVWVSFDADTDSLAHRRGGAAGTRTVE